MVAIPLTLFLVGQEQDLRQQAATPVADTACSRDSDCKTNELCTQNKCVPTATQPTIPPRTANACPVPSADIMLVLDNSNSMKGGKLAQAKRAATNFVDIVAKDKKMRVGIGTFDNNGNLVQGLTNNYQQVKNVITNQHTGGKGGTCLECSIDERGNNDVMGAFNQAGNIGNKRHVIILTDGKINRWINEKNEIVGGTKPDETRRARDQARGQSLG